MEFKIDEFSSEFPVINQNYMGYKNRYTYLAKYHKDLPDTHVGKNNVFFEGFVKYDLQDEKIVKIIKFGDHHASGEVFFHPRDKDHAEAQEEDDGYCMTFVFDWEAQTSEFVMWDAKTMDSKPVVRAKTKERVPNGFHTYFI